MATKKPPAKSSEPKPAINLRNVPRSLIEKDLAWKILEKNDLPKGAVSRLLKENKVDKEIIKRVVQRLIPYGHSSKPTRDFDQ